MKKVLLLTLFACFAYGNTVLAQCVTGDCQFGFGTFVYNNGEKYIGQFDHGEKDGQGVYFYNNNSTYSGSWKKGKFNGEGRLTKADGGVDAGIWDNGQLTQTMEVKNQCIYGDCQDGYGIYLYANGVKYMGTFKNGETIDQGVCYYPNGAKYVGQWKNRQMNGMGRLYHADGTIEEGTWGNGKYLGKAKAVIGCVEGNCENGTGTYVYRNNTKYVGDFQNSVAHGYGICYFSDGDQYIGEWKFHNFDGKGTMYHSDGTAQKGFWKNSKFLGASASTPQRTVKPSTFKAPKVWAVLVGVARYNHMKSLKYTDDDAYRMYAFLKSPEGGALPDNQIRILIDEDANKEKILETVRSTFMKADESDVVFFYFSGHGLKGSFLPIDFDGSGNKVMHKEIIDALDQCKAKSKVVIADACHSGSIDPNAEKTTAIQSTIETYYRAFSQTSGGTVLMMSSKAEETSIENNGLRQGIFSHFLIRGLKGAADMDDDKIITISELYDYVEANVKFYTNNYQTPVIYGKYDKQMPLGVVR